MNEIKSADPIANNEKSLQDMAWAIAMSVGQFSPILARCNYNILRDRLIPRLREICTEKNVKIRDLHLDKSVTKLYSQIRSELGEEVPQAIMLLGLSEVEDINGLLIAMNQVREEFRKHCPFAVVFWVNDRVLKNLISLAPDFESWMTVSEFAPAPRDLLALCRRKGDRLFEEVWKAGGDRFVVNEAILGEQYRAEIDAAIGDLNKWGEQLTPELEGILEYICGRDAYANNQIELALTHYGKSLDIWKQNQNLKGQATLLFDMGRCHGRQAQLHRKERERKTHWKKARNDFQQSIELFDRASRPDLVAQFIGQLGEVLRQLKAWGELQTLLAKSQQLHQTNETPLQIAGDYGLGAALALHEEKWREAKTQAELALETLKSGPEQQQHHQGLYLLLLAKSLRQLGQVPEAIDCLKKATEGDRQENPLLSIEILNELRSLYLKERQYLEAYEVKQERRGIEQQFGFRAFIGAGVLRPELHSNIIKGKIDSPGTVAREIIASGREGDIQRLIERCCNTQNKLTIIYGQSGVGKSSLLKAGLVPSLKGKRAGDREVLPVMRRSYNDWEKKLGKSLAEALSGLNVTLPATPSSAATILEELARNEGRNLLTVLIFDQLEEFFFVNKEPLQHQYFLKFLGKSLNIHGVKVVLSLRQDGIPYLLDGNRLDSMETISNDILGKNQLYPLDNFDPEDAKDIIQRLTERSQFNLEPALIEVIVQELASDLGKVRPIELQIVGAQMQTEDITTLTEYRERCPKGKLELVQRYLAEVVADCGEENKEAAQLVLYLLTDENIPRPQKTWAELEKELKPLTGDLAVNSEQLTLVLKILVKSGLVLLLPEVTGDRYQLVHDYVADSIRQEQSKQSIELREQLKRAQEQQKVAEAERNQALIARTIFAFLTIVLVPIAGITTFLFMIFLSESERLFTDKKELFIKGTELFRDSNQGFDAIIYAIKAAQPVPKQYFKLIEVKPSIKQLVKYALEGAVYELRERNRLSGHKASILEVSFSPDGKTIATASKDGTVKLWNRDGKQLLTIMGHKDDVNSVSFSPDGQIIATASKDGTVKLWSPEGKEIKTLRLYRNIWSVSFSPDSQTIATAGADGKVKLWNREGKELKTLKDHSKPVWDVSFSPDGEMIATASVDGTAKLWNRDGELLHTLNNGSEVLSVSFSPNSQTIATASIDGTAKLWDRNGKKLQTLKGHLGTLEERDSSVRGGWVYGVSFSPDGKTIATASLDKTAKLWNLEGKELQTLTGHNNSVNSVSFSPDGKIIATASTDGTVKLWSHDREQLQILRGQKDKVWRVSFSPDGQTIATASDDGKVKLWNRDGELIRTLQGHSKTVWDVSFSPDGQTIATASADQTVKLWNRDGELLQTLLGHGSTVYSVSFSPDGQAIATASSDKKFRLWNRDGELLQTLKGHNGFVYSVSFSPDSQMIATASADNKVKLWNRDGELIQTLARHGSGVNSVSFSPDGKIIATASEDNTAKLWSTEDGSELQTLNGHGDAVFSISFSPDGNTIATASKDKTAKLWNRDGEEIQTFRGYAGEVYSVSFSPDGKTIAIASEFAVHLWNLDYSLNDLYEIACDWVDDYLKHNPNVEESDRRLCHGVVNDR